MSHYDLYEIILSRTLDFIWKMQGHEFESEGLKTLNSHVSWNSLVLCYSAELLRVSESPLPFSSVP